MGFSASPFPTIVVEYRPQFRPTDVRPDKMAYMISAYHRGDRDAHP